MSLTLNEELKQLIDRYDLTQEQVGEHTGYSVDTVKAWCTDPTSNRYREMKPRAMKTLKMVLKIK